MVKFGNDWDEVLDGEFEKEYYLRLRETLKQEYRTQTVYPHMNNLFNAMKTTSYQGTKAVILGQDPYHNPNQAHGMAFSVMEGTPAPPSLVNMYKELQNDVGIQMPRSGNLTPWAKQGVLLLNTVLSVRENQPNSHAGIGWQTFTDSVISHLNRREDPVIFLLWGRNARNKEALIDQNRHFVLSAPHPSPLSAFHGFFGCRHFSKTNEILKKLSKEPIDWQI